MSAKERIQEYLDYKGISIYRLQNDVGLSKSYWNNTKSISASVVENILSIYDDLSPEWAITGKGSMLKYPSESIPNIPVINYERRGSPYYNVDFIGGFDIVMNDQTRNPDYYIDFEPYNHDGIVWCNISGHSMEPEINHGDFIALRKIENWKDYISMGEIYAIVTTNGLRTVKRIRKGGSLNTYTLVPSNKGYDEQEIDKEMIDSIFEVKGGVKRF